MSNKTLAVKISIQTLSDAIAALVYRHILISPASYERFGDKNRITPGLRKMWLAPAGKGRSLDLIAQDIKAYEQFSFLEEEEIIEAIIDFTESHDSAKSMESYLKERIAEQKTEKAAIDRKLTRVPVDSEDIQCYVDHALAILPKPELQKEAQDFIASPGLYFGPLLDVERCKEDLFDLPQNQQIKVVESILIATKNRPAYPIRSKTRSTKVRSINKALTHKKKPAAKKVESTYASPDDESAYYFHNRETDKLEFHTWNKITWEKLDPALKDFIKRNALYSRPKSAWISKAKYNNAYYLVSQLKKYGIPETAPQGERTTFEERFEQQRERADNRADRYENRAAKAEQDAERSFQKGRDIASFIPPGQPILVGHHSERRHRRDAEKIHNSMFKGVAELKKAEHYESKAATARETASADQLKNQGFLMRRIQDNQKIINKYQKNWKPGTYENRSGYLDATEKLAFYQRKLQELVASGAVVASKEVLKKANAHYVKNRFGWHEIVRINPNTVTVKTGYSWNQQIAYDEIKDWKSKEEAAPAPKKPAKAPRKTKVTRLKKGVKKPTKSKGKLATDANGTYVMLTPKKSTAKTKAGRKAATTMKKVKAVQVARATKRAAVKAPAKKVTKAAELKKQREKAGRELKKGLSSVGVIKIGRVINSSYRTPGAQLRDNPVTHKKVLAPTEENLKKWINRPGKYDLVGVDTGSQTVTIRKKKEGKLDKTTKTFLKKK